jgi:Na+/H+ antiporter NhaD/arsenite permease-like protein
MAAVAVVTFVIAYILIATEQVPKMVTALAGAGVILAFGIASSEDVWRLHA